MELKDWKRNDMLEELIEFLKVVGKLKKVERTGWVTNVGIEKPESVADHIFRSTILAMIFSDIKKLNTEKVMRMALVHDLSEALIGDWDTFAKKKLGLEKLKQKEEEAMEKIFSLLPENLKEKYISVWKEFQEQKTEEAKLAKQIEKLEMAIQALEYEKEGYDKKRLEVFWNDVRPALKDEELKNLFVILEKERTKSKI
jgi:putative hydrolase of HD superfamily